MNRIFVLLPLVTLGACSIHDGEASDRSFVSAYDSLPAVAMSGTVTAYVAISGGLTPVGIAKERRFGDGVMQEVRLSGDGDQNLMRIWIRNSKHTLDEAITLEKPSEAAIKAELIDNFPNLEMKVIDRPQYNSNGPYGMAVGLRADGIRCAYLWQWIDNPAKLETIPGAAQVALRVRVCKSSTSLDELAATVSNVRLGPVAAAPTANLIKTPASNPKKSSQAVRENNNLAGLGPKRPVLSYKPPSIAERRETQSFADGTPHYIVPLPDSVARNAVAPSPTASTMAYPVAQQDSAGSTPYTASTTTHRLNLPTRAFRPTAAPSQADVTNLAAQNVVTDPTGK